MYKDKYDYIIIKINSIEESHIFQKLLFSLNITWGGNRTLYNDHDGYYAISINRERNYITNYIEGDKEYVFRVKKTDGVVYKLKNLKKIKNIITIGDDIPSYKPKKIIRNV